MEIVYFIGAAILLAAIVYGVMRTSRMSQREKVQLDQNARAAQKRNDPEL